MIDEQSGTGQSFLHRADPRAKLLSAVFFAVAVATTDSLFAAGAALAVSVLLVPLATMPLRRLLKRLVPVNLFLVFLWAVVPLTYGGEALTQWGGISVSREGVLVALLVTLKANAILTAFVCLLTTSTVPDLGRGLESLGVPAKLCALILFSYRYIFVIAEEYQRLRRAAAMRCFRPSTGLHTYRTYAYLLGMTLVRSHNRAQRVRQAMVLRCFDGNFRGLRVFDWRMADGVLLSLCGLISLSVALGPFLFGAP